LIRKATDRNGEGNLRDIPQDLEGELEATTSLSRCADCPENIQEDVVKEYVPIYTKTRLY